MAVYDLTSTLPDGFEMGDILNIPYSGNKIEISLPPGQYQLECWGAQGGYRNNATYSGKGGYAKGTLTLKEEQDIYIYAGGSGQTGKTAGGFNGGGRRATYNGGGGASDIRIGTDSLYARVIVAGGGGSDGASSRGGGAGGGETAQNTTASSYGTGGFGGTQTGNTTGSGYLTTTQSTSTSSQADTYAGFGFGGNGAYYASGYGGAGGGGWYGGVGTFPDGSGDDDKGGGGGSGYVYTETTVNNYPSGCLLNSTMYLTDTLNIIGTSSIISPTGNNETGHLGDGYVRITVVDISFSNYSFLKINNEWKPIERFYYKMNNDWYVLNNVYPKINNKWYENTKPIKIPHITNTGIYGVEWNGSLNTKWTRTNDSEYFDDPIPAIANGNGSSPFDELMPWSGMVIREHSCGTMVSIPKFWYKLAQSDNGLGLKIQIADHEVEGFSVSPAHMDRGDGKGERDIVYVGRYHCASGNYKSTAGKVPCYNINRPTARTNIHNLGDNYWLWDFATKFTIWLLYLVEYADWNSQSAIGYGTGNNSSYQNMGYTDAMIYHTGTSQANKTTLGLGTQYRYIEGLWDNVFDYLDGCYFNNVGLNVILNPSDFSDSTGGISVGIPAGPFPSEFTVKNISEIFPIFVPIGSHGSTSTYLTDSWYWSLEEQPYVFTGGWYRQEFNTGLFCMGSATDSANNIGCRIMELP